MSKYNQLTEFERERISKMLAAGCSNTEIATLLGRSISTVGREVYRNCADGEYLVVEAHKKASRLLLKASRGVLNAFGVYLIHVLVLGELTTHSHTPSASNYTLAKYKH